MPPTPTPTITPVPGSQVATNIAGLAPWMIFFIVVLAFIALMVSLWMVYNYINSIRMTAIHADMLRDAVFQSRYAALREQVLGLGYVSSGRDWGPSAESLEEQREATVAEIADFEYKLEGLKLLNQSEDSRKQIRDLEWEISKRRRSLETELSEIKIKEIKEATVASEKQRKDEEERLKRERDVRDEKMKQQAKSEAENLVPSSLTVAGMGITGSFFIRPLAKVSMS